MREVIMKLCLPCPIDQVVKILAALPSDTTLADTRQVGRELWIYRHEEPEDDGER